MSTETPTPQVARPSLLRNWLSMTGLVVVSGSLFSIFFLFLLEMMARGSNPYVGILTFVVAPAFLVFGLLLTGAGAWRERRKLGQSVGLLPAMVVDLSRARDRKIMGAFVLCSLGFLLLTAVGSYHTYHFSESTVFCGQTCHTVMKPELVTYQNGPHARVSCTECHIGKGATWFVRSKLSGTYQLYATTFNKYPRPVPTPIQNLRPAQETCEQCHWPKKFVGNLERTFNYALGNETNSPFSLSLLMKVGGADPTHGPEGGIHWHMNVRNRIEYIATDGARQTIPWVRMTDPLGVVTEFRTKTFTNAPSPELIRRMDCMDCHNRPAHMYKSPGDAVNLAISLGHIDRTLPWIKTNAVYVLTREYRDEAEALRGIATTLAERYPDPGTSAGQRRQAIESVQQIYTNSFFPEMKASWKAYPDNIGHKAWPGCFRCHDGKHVTADGKRSIKANDCNACHTILAQGTGAQLLEMTPGGQEFKHPGGDYDADCTQCHSPDMQ
jgi:nitrate/TMAO reductase-like tetraheme cytochrome c subunit